MITRRTALLLAALAALAGVCVGCVAAEAASPWQSWSALQFKAKSALFRGQVEMRLVEDADGRRLETSTVARFLGATVARSETTTSFDAESGATRTHESFSRKRGRRYTFRADGYDVEKLRPAEDDEAADDWVVYFRAEHPHSEDDGGALFDYYGMLLHLRHASLDEPGDEVTLTVATSGGPEPFRIRVEESRSGERSFTDLATGEAVTLPLVEFRLSVRPTDPEVAEGFLKMEGETEIWVESKSKTPLEIGGKIPKVPGKVRLVLTAMESR